MSRNNWNSLREPRQGVMLHYDASGSDKGAVEWLLHDPKCEVSYTKLVLDSGEVVRIAPDDKRAWHAGVCRPSQPGFTYKDANSAFYGLALAATDGDLCTPAAFLAVVRECRGYFAAHQWSLTEDLWRIVGHDEEAWPRNRKPDPVGTDCLHPLLPVSGVRAALRRGIQ